MTVDDVIDRLLEHVKGPDRLMPAAATPTADRPPPTPRPARRRSSTRATLMRIKSLQLRARVVVEGFFSGLHRSPYHGFSVEFSEYRQYTPGDDPRYLDWQLFARSDRYYVKRFEDETNLRCYLLRRLSAGRWATARWRTRKGDYARTAAATLAYFLSLQRDAVGLVTFDDRDRRLPPAARTGPGHLHRLMAALEREPRGPGDRPRRAARAGRRDRPQARPGRADLRPARPGRRAPDAGSATSGPRARGGRPPRPRPGGGRVSPSTTPAMFHDVEIGPRAVRRPARGRGPSTAGGSPPTPPRSRRPAPTWGSTSSRSPPTGRWSWCCSTS